MYISLLHNVYCVSKNIPDILDSNWTKIIRSS